MLLAILSKNINHAAAFFDTRARERFSWIFFGPLKFMIQGITAGAHLNGGGLSGAADLFL